MPFSVPRPTWGSASADMSRLLDAYEDSDEEDGGEGGGVTQERTAEDAPGLPTRPLVAAGDSDEDKDDAGGGSIRREAVPVAPESSDPPPSAATPEEARVAGLSGSPPAVPLPAGSPPSSPSVASGCAEEEARALADTPLGSPGEASPRGSEALALPPSPPGDPEPALLERVRHLREVRKRNKSIRDHIDSSRDYSNPYILERIIKVFELEEHGSNYPPEIFDPSRIVAHASDYYDAPACERPPMPPKRRRRDRDEDGRRNGWTAPLGSPAVNGTMSAAAEEFVPLGATAS